MAGRITRAPNTLTVNDLFANSFVTAVLDNLPALAVTNPDGSAIGGGGGGGGGTQYTQGGSAVINPTGNSLIYFNASNLPLAVTTTQGLPVTLTNGSSLQNVNLNEVGGATFALGQTTMSASLPVTLASNQSALAVTGTFFQATQPISAASLPLPSGASTSALQTTGNTSLASIATNTGNIPPLGQALNAASVPVVLTASQLTTLTPPAAITGYATSANQTNKSQVSQLADGSGNIIASTSNALNVNISSGSIANTSFAATQATASSLNATVVGTGTFAVQAAQSGTWTNTVTQATGTNLHTVVDSGSITATAAALPSAEVNGQTTGTTAGTAVQLATNALVNGVIVQALSANTSSIFVGTSTVSSTNGFELQPGQATSVAVSNTNAVWIVSVTNGDKVCWIGS